MHGGVSAPSCCQCRRHKRQGADPWLGRSPRGRHGNPGQYSCLENPYGQRSLGGCRGLSPGEESSQKRHQELRLPPGSPQSQGQNTAASEACSVRLRHCAVLEMRPSSIAPSPAESREAPPPPQDPSPLRGTLGSSLRSPAEGEGQEGFPPPSDKDLESPSSTRLEALVPSRDSRARTPGTLGNLPGCL